MLPNNEFSIGIIPKDLLEETSSKISLKFTLAIGMQRLPKKDRAACSLKAPASPWKANSANFLNYPHIGNYVSRICAPASAARGLVEP